MEQRIGAGLAEREAAVWRDSRHFEQADGRDIPLNGRLEGPTRPARSLAGLTYGVALPQPWQSKVEPVEPHRAALVPGAPPTLRIEGSKDTQVFQWLPMTDQGGYRATIQLRGRLSPSVLTALTLGWLDKDQRNIGVTMIRLPEGEWPEWVELVQGGRPPKGAHYVGIGLAVRHQGRGDWIEAREFSLRSLPMAP